MIVSVAVALFLSFRSSAVALTTGKDKIASYPGKDVSTTIRSTASSATPRNKTSSAGNTGFSNSSSIGFDATDCLAAHNEIRIRSNIPALIWNSSLADDAANYARKLSGEGVAFDHEEEKDGDDFGENLHSGSADCRSAVNSWYSERSLYRGEPLSESNYKKVGHFTQLMWRNTTSVGCGASTKKVVCRYYKQGNVFGEALTGSW